MSTRFARISIFVASTVLMFGNFNFVKGDSEEGPVQSQVFTELDLNLGLPLNLNPLDAVNAAGIKSIDTQDILKGFKFNLPLNVKSLNIDTNIPISPKFNTSQGVSDINLKQFLIPKDISLDDLRGAIKAVITLVIEIFLVVISILSQILKLILEFLR